VAFLPVLPDLPGKGIGHFVGAMDIDGFIDTTEFKSRMDQWIRRFKKKALEEGRGEAHYWWQQTLLDIAKKRGQKAADDLRKRMNEQKDKK
jgi:hypothetical protein